MFIQQGDVLLKSVSKLPEGKKIGRQYTGYGRGRFILAEGEVTGHCHAICDDVTMVDANGVMYLQNDKPVELGHEEHHNVEVPAGIWEIGIVQEYDHFAEEAKNVKD
jgi:hypothetical protein